MNRRVLVSIGSLLLLIVISVIALSRQYSSTTSPDTEPETVESYTATLTGTYLCLPHSDTSGPQTLECALGLQIDAGDYYALDFNASPTTPATLATGSKITVTGIVTPVEMLSSDHWRKYPIKGIFSVRNK
jgi:hypothetical protein